MARLAAGAHTCGLEQNSARARLWGGASHSSWATPGTCAEACSEAQREPRPGCCLEPARVSQVQHPLLKPRSDAAKSETQLATSDKQVGARTSCKRCFNQSSTASGTCSAHLDCLGVVIHEARDWAGVDQSVRS